MGQTLESRKYHLIARITAIDNAALLDLLEKMLDEIPRPTLSAEALERHRQIIMKGVDLSQWGDPAEWQREQCKTT